MSKESYTIRDRILQILQPNAEEGVTQDILLASIDGVNLEDLLQNLNDLLREGRILIYQSPKSPDIIYKPVSIEDFEKLKDLAQDQLLIYRLIEGAQRDGIWMRTLKLKSKLQNTQINKAIKVLEQKKLIKSFKSVLAKTKKYYILYDLQPAPEHMGGIWYGSDLEFDRELVNDLTDQCYQYALYKGSVTTEELKNHIKDSKISQVELQLDDVQKLVDSLVFDGKIEPIRNPIISSKLKEAVVYKPSKVSLKMNGITMTPCGTCPVFNLCSEDGEISPSTCVYLKQWLNY